MAIVVIGSLVSSMILTLLVVSVIYKMINPLDRWLRKWYEVYKMEIEVQKKVSGIQKSESENLPL